MNLKQFNQLKILNHWDTISKFLNGKNPFPVSCEIDTANICNHRCVWCYFAESRSDKAVMPEKILFKLIEDLAKGETKSITFTGGGEPLINPATIYAIEKAVSLKIKTGLVTNGALLNEKKCKIIIKNCEFVRFSLDAGSLKTHILLHNPSNPKFDNFERIIDNLKRLVEIRKNLKRNVTIGIGFLVHEKNYKEIKATAELVKEIGVDYFQVRPLFIPGELSYTKTWLKAKKIVNDALKLSDTKFYVFPIARRFEEIINNKKNYSICLIHNLLAIAGADSNIYMCSLFRGDKNFSFGSLKEQNFKEIWNSERRREVIKSLKINNCPSCRYNTYNEILEYLFDKKRPHGEFL